MYRTTPTSFTLPCFQRLDASLRPSVRVDSCVRAHAWWGQLEYLLISE